MKIFTCDKCRIKMVAEPSGPKYEKIIQGGYAIHNCDVCMPVHGEVWYTPLDEYLQKQSIEAWK